MVACVNYFYTLHKLAYCKFATIITTTVLHTCRNSIHGPVHGKDKSDTKLTAYTTAANSDAVKVQSSLLVVEKTPEISIKRAPKKYE